jgi:hypothetical protein
VLVRECAPLGDHTVDALSLEPAEPLLGHGRLVGDGSGPNGGIGRAKQHLQPATPFPERQVAEILVPNRQDVEGDEASRRLVAKSFHPRGGGMKPGQQRLEVGPTRTVGHDLAVNDETFRLHGADSFGELGEVARQGSVIPAAKVHRGSVAERHAPKAVPLRLIEVIAHGKNSG